MINRIINNGGLVTACAKSDLKFLGLECCSGISRKVIEKLDRNIKIEWPNSDSDNESVQNLSGPER